MKKGNIPKVLTYGFLVNFIWVFSYASSPIEYFPKTENDHKLTVKIVGLKEIKGNIRICLVDSKAAFPGDCKYAKVEKVTSTQMSIIFENVPAGQYAVSLIHDKNMDGEMNFNFLGIPQEKYGFSNNPPSTFGQPEFEECTFSLKGDIGIEIKI